MPFHPPRAQHRALCAALKCFFRSIHPVLIEEAPACTAAVRSSTHYFSIFLSLGLKTPGIRNPLSSARKRPFRKGRHHLCFGGGRSGGVGTEACGGRLFGGPGRRLLVAFVNLDSLYERVSCIDEVQYTQIGYPLNIRKGYCPHCQEKVWGKCIHDFGSRAGVDVITCLKRFPSTIRETEDGM